MVMKKFQISFSPDIPLYYQIEAFFKFKINTGELKNGDRIPDERSLCEANNISLGTLRKAFERLESEGLIVRKRGKGTYVSGRKESNRLPVEMKLIGYVEDLILHGKNADVSILELDEITADAEMSSFFGIQPGEALTHFKRLKSVDNEPLYYVENFIIPELGRVITKEDLQSSPPLELFSKKFNRQIEYIKQEINVTKADAEKASFLKIDIFEPLLYIILYVYEQKNKPIGISKLYCRPDRYKFVAELTRPKNMEFNTLIE